MNDPVRNDILKLFKANPLLRDTPEVIAGRIGRSFADVEKTLKELESEGVVAVRWAGGAPLHFFTGLLPNDEPTDRTGSGQQPHSGVVSREATSGTASKIASGEGAAGEDTAGEDTAGEAAPTDNQTTANRARFRKSAHHSAVPTLEVTVRAPATLEGIQSSRSAIEALCRAGGMDRGSLMEFTIAMSEALTNAYRYGRRGDRWDRLKVELKLFSNEVEVLVTDRGSGFPSILVGTSTADARSTGGRGLMLMRSLCDEFGIEKTGEGATVRLVKRWDPPENSTTADSSALIAATLDNAPVSVNGGSAGAMSVNGGSAGAMSVIPEAGGTGTGGKPPEEKAEGS